MVSSILPDEDAHHPDTATDASTKGSTRRPTHVSINACLAPLCAMDRCHVITSEGLGNPREVRFIKNIYFFSRWFSSLPAYVMIGADNLAKIPVCACMCIHVHTVITCTM